MFTHCAISKKYLTMFVIALAFAAIIHVGYAISEPTFDEKLTGEIEALQGDWSEQNEIEALERKNSTEATTRANRANEKKVEIEERANTMRSLLTTGEIPSK